MSTQGSNFFFIVIEFLSLQVKERKYIYFFLPLFPLSFDRNCGLLGLGKRRKGRRRIEDDKDKYKMKEVSGSHVGRQMTKNEKIYIKFTEIEEKGGGGGR